MLEREAPVQSEIGRGGGVGRAKAHGRRPPQGTVTLTRAPPVTGTWKWRAAARIALSPSPHLTAGQGSGARRAPPHQARCYLISPACGLAAGPSCSGAPRCRKLGPAVGIDERGAEQPLHAGAQLAGMLEPWPCRGRWNRNDAAFPSMATATRRPQRALMLLGSLHAAVCRTPSWRILWCGICTSPCPSHVVVVLGSTQSWSTTTRQDCSNATPDQLRRALGGGRRSIEFAVRRLPARLNANARSMIRRLQT